MEQIEQNTIQRDIRSFVLRQGKITSGQLKAINELLPKFGIEYNPQRCDLNAAFGRNNHKIVEIGFGMGHATWQIAKNNQENDYLGIEVHLPGVGALLMQMRDNDVNNLRIIRHDAVEVFKNMLADDTLAGIHIYFPDPWHKKRHHKRRIIQAAFVELLAQKLKPGGYLHLATDWQDYAFWMLEILSQEPRLINQAIDVGFVPRPEYRPLTKFENRGLKLGHGVWDLIFIRK